VVQIALELARQPKLIPTPVSGVPRAFRVPEFSDPSWRRCRDGLIHPHTHLERPITFDPEVIKDRDDVVLAHLNHRLVQRCLRLLRAEIWAPAEQQKIYRVTARIVPHVALRAPAILAHARLTVVSRDSQRLHEEVISAGGIITEGKLERLNVSQVNDLLAAQSSGTASEAITTRLVELWPQLRKLVQTALDARGRDRTQSIQRQLTERAETEVAKIQAIFAELERSIRAELDDPHQLELFSTYTAMEQEQACRNHDFLRDRLRLIPSDLNREIETIRNRFSDPTPRLFPIAVTFLVPEGLKA
jgi:hypothetical protein